MRVGGGTERRYIHLWTGTVDFTWSSRHSWERTRILTQREFRCWQILMAKLVPEEERKYLLPFFVKVGDHG